MSDDAQKANIINTNDSLTSYTEDNQNTYFEQTLMLEKPNFTSQINESQQIILKSRTPLKNTFHSIPYLQCKLKDQYRTHHPKNSLPKQKLPLFPHILKKYKS